MTATTDNLRTLATEFTQAADEYQREPGMQDDLLADEMRRAGSTLHLVAVLADEQIYTPVEAYIWLHAGRKIMAQVQGANA